MPFLITCIAKMLFADVRICNPIHILLREVLPFRKKLSSNWMGQNWVISFTLVNEKFDQTCFQLTNFKCVIYYDIYRLPFSQSLVFFYHLAF
jgi:hypothetical protein